MTQVLRLMVCPVIVGIALARLAAWKNILVPWALVSFSIFSWFYIGFYWQGYNEGGDFSAPFAKAANILMRTGMLLGMACGYFELLYVLVRQRQKGKSRGFEIVQRHIK